MPQSLRKYWLLFGVTFAVVVAGSVAFIAQAGRDDTSPPPDTSKAAATKPAPEKFLNLSDDELREVVQVLNLYTLEKELALSDDQLVRVLPKWRQLLEMRREFWGDRRDRLDDLRGVLTTHEEDAASTDLDGVVDGFRGEDDAFWGRYRKIEVSILAELTSAQKVRYILIDSEQGRRTRRLVGTLKRINRPPQPHIVQQEPQTDPKPTTVTTADR